MGTRHLIGVILKGKWKIAQYGQWDGYPEGQGKDVVEFLKKLTKVSPIGEESNIDKFKRILRNQVSFLPKNLSEEDSKKLFNPDYHSRDLGAKILDVVFNSEKNIKLSNNAAFGADSLFCEFAYVLDLDKLQLEFYRGFNKEKVPSTNRFAKFKTDDEYEHIRLVEKYNFDDQDILKKMLAR